MIRDKKYMVYCLENFPCYPCQLKGYNNMSETRQFHHIQYPRYGAMFRDDSRGVVVCYNCHVKIHTWYGEKKFWKMMEVDPNIYAGQIYKHYKENIYEKKKPKRKHTRSSNRKKND